MKKYLTLLLILFAWQYTYTQPFNYIDAGFVEAMQGASSWVDYNRDGYPDAFITGNKYSGEKQLLYSQLERNRKNGSFSNVVTGIPGIYLSALDWGDYDKDGDPDLILCGETKNGKLITALFRNNRTSFTRMNVSFAPVRNGSVQWGDFDGDGDLDILLSGEGEDDILVTKIYLNNGGSRFVESGLALTPVFRGTVRWADMDDDGDLDILLTGESYNNRLIGKIYRNEDGELYETSSNITPVRFSSAAWGDLNNDGHPDLIVAGEAHAGRILTIVYKNDGQGKFTETDTYLTGARTGNIDLGDYDMDGDLDIIITGETYDRSVTRVYRNEGGFVFSDMQVGLPGVSMGGGYWGDYDQDGDPDILLTGLDNCYDFTGKLYRNDGVYKKKEKKKAEPESNIFTTRPMNIEKKSYYYFVYASCFCDPFGEGEKAFHAFVGNIHYAPEKYALMERFNSIIMKNLVNWDKVDAGHRVSVGYITEKEAETGRQTVIREYEDQGFTVHYVNW